MESELVENAKALTTIFGEWPSFHDAEVVSMRLDREGTDAPILEATIHVFLMTTDVDAKGFFVLTHHTLVTLRFSNILLRQLRWFNHQNVISDLLIGSSSRTDDSEHRAYDVKFGSCWGVEADLSCDQILVLKAEPFVPKD